MMNENEINIENQWEKSTAHKREEKGFKLNNMIKNKYVHKNIFIINRIKHYKK